MDLDHCCLDMRFVRAEPLLDRPVNDRDFCAEPSPLVAGVLAAGVFLVRCFNITRR